MPSWRCCRRLQARPRSQNHCEGKHVTTTFRQEVSEPKLPTNLGASTTLLRTRSIVLMSIEANAPQQQQEGSANMRPTPFGRLHAWVDHPISGLRHGGSLVQKTPRMIGDELLLQHGLNARVFSTKAVLRRHLACRSTSTAVAGQGRRSVACRTERLAARMDFKQASSIPIPASAML